MPLLPSSPDEPIVALAELRLVQTPAGYVLQVHTTSEGFADHAWLQRDRLLQLSEGAQVLEIHLSSAAVAEPLKLSYSPQLPQHAAVS
jgi:hypothetical protein